MEKNILILGKGGREHALARKCRSSNLCNELYVIPGNDGIKDCATINNEINYSDMNEVLKFAIEKNIDLTIVGDEMFLEKGVVDLFDKNNLTIFGPAKDAAKIESSKMFAKNLMKKYNIPTADFITTSDKNVAIDFLKANKKYPIVIKNDGLASGKGVFITNSLEESIEAVEKILDQNIFNNEKCGVVIEEFLVGKEFSLLALVNGDIFECLQPAKDYKKIFENDKGENTGGMGCYTPVDYVTKDIIEYSKIEIIKKTIDALKQEGTTYKGVLYAGLILTDSNEVKVIEFNSRFGDPETEVLMPALQSDLVESILDLLNNKQINLVWNKENFVGVTIASKGYPQEYKNNVKIADQEIFDKNNIFHMGTKYNDEKKYFESNGGRILFIYNSDLSKKEAIKKVYENINKIKFENFYFRKDIGV
ncbi:phosphoribosylamine--glycine ligase [Spiroplasma tabanidicola]|uniref:Phosphoribosylamine--glycine ligase n=1 Tax=Spiroplasma tabanidicola TaxID=324079 RepID=A0A6I6C7R3_9MOLU|nr:phosphoribosylamine--glycine ligase [Spiroplasma tabanidicola]QGS52260.1 phosphoribosylamine---glycine ligase [Spiroplasma tabanidicola]